LHPDADISGLNDSTFLSKSSKNHKNIFNKPFCVIVVQPMKKAKFLKSLGLRRQGISVRKIREKSFDLTFRETPFSWKADKLGEKLRAMMIKY
jgi:hypothetical protein